MFLSPSRCTSTDSGPPPALTRESTNSNAASVLPTPMDHPFYSGQDELKAKTLVPPAAETVRIRSPPSQLASVESAEINGEFEVPPVDSYFPPTQSPATPARTNSTKELISRYEAMTPNTFGVPSRTPVPSPLGAQQDSFRPDSVSSRPLSVLKDRNRSPLRDSFRNLMSIFAKKGKGKDDGSSFVTSRYESPISSSPGKVLTVASPQPHENNPVIVCDKPPLRSGSVLYLARSSNESMFPVWVNCKASLFEDFILLESFTAYGNPSSNTIVLKKSTDVHSLAKSQVDPTEKNLLPLTGQDAYIFELTYPGGVPEKFATTSVAERSAWVSSIWDTLLKLEKALDIETTPHIDSSRLPSEQAVCVLSPEPACSDPPVPLRLLEERSPPRFFQETPTVPSAKPSPTTVAQSRLENIRMRTGRYHPDSVMGSSTLAQETKSTPSTPTKATRGESSSDLSFAESPRPSISNLESPSIVQRRLSLNSESNYSPSISRAPTQLTRYTSTASNYSSSSSRAPIHLVTPQSIRKYSSRRTSKTVNPPLSRTVSLDSKNEDGQSLFDFYVQPSTSARPLSPVLDTSESQCADTPRASVPSSRNICENLSIQTPVKVKEPEVTGIKAIDALRDDRSLPDVKNNMSQATSERTVSSYVDIRKPQDSGGESNAHPVPDLANSTNQATPARKASGYVEIRYLQGSGGERKADPAPDLATTVTQAAPARTVPGHVDVRALQESGGKNRRNIVPQLPNNMDQATSARIMSNYVNVRNLQDSAGENKAHPLVTLIEDHATQQYAQTSGIADQIGSLRQDVLAMSNELKIVIAEQEPGSALRRLLEDLCLKMEQSAATNGAGLRELHEKIDSVATLLSKQHRIVADNVPQAPVPQSSGENSSQHFTMLEKVSASADEARDVLKNEMSFIKEKLSSLQPPAQSLEASRINTKLDELLELYRTSHGSQADDKVPNAPPRELRNIDHRQEAKALDTKENEVKQVSKTHLMIKETGAVIEADADEMQTAAEVEANTKKNMMKDKVTEVIKVEDTKTNVPKEKSAEGARMEDTKTSAAKEGKGMEADSPTPEDIESKLQEVLSLLKDERVGKKIEIEQQTENTRYLQELNKWLESFVENGTAQIQSVAHGVERLCHELAPPHENIGKSTDTGPAGIRSDLAALAASVQAGETRDAALHALATETLQVIKSKESEANSLDINAVVQMIDQQKEEQAAMLRAIASELSNDIRGERLRFVEAMKEATAINVQVHVEEFKKELSKEVMMMTCEVGRLQRERQTLEQQIADLFTFYAKQRAELEQNQAEVAPQGLKATTDAPPTRSDSRRRPLPDPKDQRRQIKLKRIHRQ